MYNRRVSKCHPRVEAYGAVDELTAADVDPHVAQTVEEDEIPRFELVLRNGDADVPEITCVVGER